MRLLIVLVAALVACDESTVATQPAGGDAAAPPGRDGGGPVRPKPVGDGGAGEACGERSPFVRVTRLDALSTERDEGRISLTEDELTVVFQRLEASGTVLLLASRPSADEAFGEPVAIDVTAAAGASGGAAPAISPDGLRIVFTAAVDGSQKLWLLERSSRVAAFGAPKRALTELNEGVLNAAASFSRDGKLLYFSSSRLFTAQGPFENNNIFVADGSAGTYAKPTPLTDDTDKPLAGVDPAIAADGRTLYFSRFTPTGFQMFVADLEGTRATKVEPIDPERGPNQSMGAISGDHCRLYFAAATKDAKFDVFVADRR